jgi:hypothetical protein
MMMRRRTERISMRSSRNSRSSTVGVEDDCHGGFDGDAEDHGGDDKEKQGAGREQEPA